jgi:hypothetical protein
MTRECTQSPRLEVIASGTLIHVTCVCGLDYTVPKQGAR